MAANTAHLFHQGHQAPPTSSVHHLVQVLLINWWVGPAYLEINNYNVTAEEDTIQTGSLHLYFHNKYFWN